MPVTIPRLRGLDDMNVCAEVLRVDVHVLEVWTLNADCD